MRIAIVQRSEDYKNAQRYANGLQAAAIQWHCGSAMGASYHFPDLHFTGERTCHLLLACAEEVSTFRSAIRFACRLQSTNMCLF